MKKYLLFLLLIGFAFSCHDTEEPEALVPDPPVLPPENPPVVPPVPVGKPATKVYFSEYDVQRIGIIDLSKPGEFSTFLDFETNNILGPAGIAVNPVGKRLYFTEQDGATIRRINLDSTVYRVVYDSDQGLLSPTAIAVDTLGKKMYWADISTGQIMVGDLFGSVAPAALFDGDVVIATCYGIAIDNKNKKIYFADNYPPQISVGNLDGTGKPVVIYDENTENIGCPSRLTFSDDNLYWTDDCFNNILRASTTTTGNPVVLYGEEDGISYPSGIAIDKADKKIYWSETDGSTIARASLDGTGTREIILENIQANCIYLEFED